MKFLGKIFGSETKVKLMRFFIFNPADGIDTEMLAKRTSSPVSAVRRECRELIGAGFIKKKVVTREVEHSRGKVKRKYNGFIYDPLFPFAESLKALLVEAAPMRNDLLVKRLQKVGRIKLVVVAGIFIQEDESRLDLLIVGDRLNRVPLERTVRVVESELGRELRYAFFETPEFRYRTSVFDKLIRDVFDNPHQVLLDKRGTVE